ncbi:adenosylcobyric acid synthase (glutamine-hydrolysing) [Rubellimicrobium thermophilum DSM 16684]|uniref:Cobyric acid synthase n=1 Tax=Rubellimicrobium thermophilum DSM 16684 TaxID=1123069 RepID=S9R7M8_9RHOB|nr:cobyric acid synthase [Rubellimicrobium thermophilum]EPX87902.1 adenosylcobyric acid synthase (glutamine-hydrolysing) [Rubellimicrobium thermophilum DSM 16684]
MARAVMIQGAGSNVGKSLLVAGLARAFRRRGLGVAPFKPQNMSNNAAVTADGGEIGRAQALQARAAGLDPLVDMNPVLLKPETETGAQVIVQGRRLASVRARDYAVLKPSLMQPVLESFRRLAKAHDLILVEGAGSPAEINLRTHDIANMGFAVTAGVPVILVGDIDRGGVIAQLVGTHAVLDPGDRAMIRGFAVNKFRGDPALFEEGRRAIEERTGWCALGVVPWFEEAWRLPAEDILDLSARPAGHGGTVKVAVPRLPRIANFDDLDPLTAHPGVSVEIVPPGRALPGDADLVILPGSKATLSDLAALRAEGWDIDLLAHRRRGGHILGFCGGYQMLGRRIEDPLGIEGPPGGADGLGFLDITTVMTPRKTLGLVSGRHPASGSGLRGYEIHMGRSSGPDCARAWLSVEGRPEGAASADGRVRGTYLHGLLGSDDFRAALLAELGAKPEPFAWDAAVESALDGLADHVSRHLDLEAILEISGRV